MATAEAAVPAPGSAPGEKGLKSGSLGLISSIVMGMASTAFFRGETLPRRSYGELVLAPAGGAQVPTVSLPDSGSQATVIAPDLSNLPPGLGPEDVKEAPDAPPGAGDDEDPDKPG